MLKKVTIGLKGLVITYNKFQNYKLNSKQKLTQVVNTPFLTKETSIKNEVYLLTDQFYSFSGLGDLQLKFQQVVVNPIFHSAQFLMRP